MINENFDIVSVTYHKFSFHFQCGDVKADAENVEIENAGLENAGPNLARVENAWLENTGTLFMCMGSKT